MYSAVLENRFVSRVSTKWAIWQLRVSSVICLSVVTFTCDRYHIHPRTSDNKWRLINTTVMIPIRVIPIIISKTWKLLCVCLLY